MTAHPDDAVLLEHLARKVQGPELEGLLDHLAECDECVDRLLDLEALRPEEAPSPDDGAEEGGRTVDFELEAAWRELRPRLEPAPRPESLEAPSEPKTETGWGSRVEVLRTAAAILLVVSGLLGVRSFQLAERGHELERRLRTPQADVPVLYLEAVRADGGAETIPAGDGVALLMVTPSDPRPFESYGARLLDGDDREIWSADALTLSEHGSLRIALPRSLPPGAYKLQLSGVLSLSDPAAGPELLETHRLTLR